MNRKYKVLSKNNFSEQEFHITPIRDKDRHNIMRWRNEQMYHLRQSIPLSKDEQDYYFKTRIAKLFDEEYPVQFLFSFLKNDKCIGYGGLVHINWKDSNAEISFVMQTSEESENFKKNWTIFLKLIEKVAFDHLEFKKIYIYSFDLRPKLYEVTNENHFIQEARLKNHVFSGDAFFDVLIHSKFSNNEKS
jgi:RimJ/RimL family protein N-acetyltransferase